MKRIVVVMTKRDEPQVKEKYVFGSQLEVDAFFTGLYVSPGFFIDKVVDEDTGVSQTTTPESGS